MIVYNICRELRYRRRHKLLLRRLRRLLLIPKLLGLPTSFSSSGHLPFVKPFSNKEIIKATFGFNMLVGSDSHGDIYKARFPDGLVASVRKVRDFQGNGGTFYREVQLLGRLHHRHVVKLRGYSEGHDRFLVFDYMENGSLKTCLHDPLKTPLNWRARLQVAISVAASLEYLHFFCDPPVCNISIDSTNVFLDENFVAKICDFGLLGSDRSLNLESDLTHSEGFIDHRTRHVIFQFGVLILELITGQSFESEGVELIRWIQSSGFTYSMHKMVDADLGSSYDSEELKSLLNIARLCTRTADKPTVSIRQILRYLQRKAELQPHVSQSQYC